MVQLLLLIVQLKLMRLKGVLTQPHKFHSMEKVKMNIMYNVRSQIKIYANIMGTLTSAIRTVFSIYFGFSCTFHSSIA